MKLSADLMLKLLKEEYDKRLDFYLGEVETRAKHSKSDGELVRDAEGLKLKDRAGFMFTLKRIEADEGGKLCAYLIPSGKGNESFAMSRSESRLDDDMDREESSYEDDFESEESDYMYSGVREADEDVDEKAKKPTKKKKSLKNDSNRDIIDPSPKAKFKKQHSIDINAKQESYEEVDGLIKVSLEQLEKDFTL
jgi:hypothetical protein